MDTVSYEINIFLVLLSVDDMYKIILYAICLTSYLFVGMWNRTEKITIITDNKILTL